MKRTVMLSALVVISFVMTSDAARGQDPAIGQNVKIKPWAMTKDSEGPMAKAGLDLARLYNEHESYRESYMLQRTGEGFKPSNPMLRVINNEWVVIDAVASRHHALRRDQDA